MSGRLRCGLVGTGLWASEAHAPALAAHPEVDFAGIWGREPEAATRLAERVGTRAYPSVDDLFGDVEAVSFAVTPAVQPELATRAAQRHVHLMLEKPIALSSAAAAALRDATEQAGVASVVCFTGRFIPQLGDWLAELAGQGGWECGRAELFSSALVSDSGFETSSWRRSAGGLWDLGPHGIASLQAVLGDVVSVTARGGRRDLVHLILGHASGASSTLSCSITMPEPACGRQVYAFHGANGVASAPSLPAGVDHRAAAYARAIDSLVRQARSGARDEPCDVSLGAHVVDVLDAAQRSIATSCSEAVPLRASQQSAPAR